MLRTVTSEAAQRALCTAAMLVLMAGFFTTALRLLIRSPTAVPRRRCVALLAPGLEGCCCGRSPAHRHHRDSSAASSEEDFVGSEDARLQRCVRTTAPNLLVGGSYEHVAKVDACTARGMSALAGGTPPPDAAAVITDCVDGQAFPADLQPFVDDFKDCVNRVLT